VDTEAKLSDELEGWAGGDGPKTLGSLVALFGERSFAVLFVLLMAVPALPLPTGGVTHVFELIVMLVALQLIAGRRMVWLPVRWRGRDLSSTAQGRFFDRLLRTIRWLERHSKTRLEFLVSSRPVRSVYGVVVLALTVAAFLAPPFSGLDTLPALGVVVISLGILLGDSVFVLAGIAIGVAGVIAEITLGSLAAKGIGSLF
jgi:hypothetical protein